MLPLNFSGYNGKLFSYDVSSPIIFFGLSNHMSDLRKDPIVGRWVIVAENQGRTAAGFRIRPGERPADGIAPSAKVNEHHTPGEIAAIREPNSAANRKGWRVRVVPNKFPALEIEGELNKQGEGSTT